MLQNIYFSGRFQTVYIFIHTDCIVMQNNTLNSNALEVMGACKYGDYVKSIYHALVTIKLIVVTLSCAYMTGKFTHLDYSLHSEPRY